MSTPRTMMLETVEENECDEDESPDIKLVIVGTRCPAMRNLKDALQQLQLPTVFSPTGVEHISAAASSASNDDESFLFFVYDRFDDEIFAKLHKSDCRIVGPPVVIKCAIEKLPFPFSPRPLYCILMQHVVVCFTGYKVKEELRHLVDLVHHMGGTIRREMSARVTHLVANHAGGESYRAAVGLGTKIMTDNWIKRSWSQRDDITITAQDKQFDQFHMSPFFNCTLSFLGFAQDEQRHMEDLTIENGGSFVPLGNPAATHIIVDETNVNQLPDDLETNEKVWIIKGEWFWGSIQMNACAREPMYRFISQSHQELTPSRLRQLDRCTSGSKMKKRKRLQQNLAVLALEGEVDSPYSNKRQSTELSQLSLSASLLDESEDLDKDDKSSDVCKTDQQQQQTAVLTSARLQVVRELLQTERNYVAILQTILELFRDGITDPTQPLGPVLPMKDVELIFGDLPSIMKLHVELRDELSELINNWSEEYSIGKLFLKHAPAMTVAYPPFVNFFSQTKETIAKCDKSNPRFHAFLKRCQTRPECGRQTLPELLIRPVQRLPSVMLLLNDIKKHTASSNDDYTQLEKAVAALKEVMTHINEDKRKTERQVAMFDVMNDVENCPPHLLSAHRRLITKVNVIELSEELSGKGSHLTLFLFNDYLEICKRKLKASTTYKSPGVIKPYRHLELVSLPMIKRVVDIQDSDSDGTLVKTIFGIICRNTIDQKEHLYSYIVTDDTDKSSFLLALCQQIANSTCRTDHENLLISAEKAAFNIDTSDINLSSFSNKMQRFASKTRKRVSRAFSFTQTPRKLKRATSNLTENSSSSSPTTSYSENYTRTPTSSTLHVAGGRLAASTLSLEVMDTNQSSPVFPSPMPPVSTFNTPISDGNVMRRSRSTSMIGSVRNQSATSRWLQKIRKRSINRKKSITGSDIMGLFGTLRHRRSTIINKHSPNIKPDSPIPEVNSDTESPSTSTKTPQLSTALKRSVTLATPVSTLFKTPH